jgi:hypothetical protein
MNADAEDPEFEMVTVEPESVLIGDGEVVIYDHGEFSELTNSLAAMVRDFELWVLDRDTLRWRKVEPKKGKLAMVKKEQASP